MQGKGEGANCVWKGYFSNCGLKAYRVKRRRGVGVPGGVKLISAPEHKSLNKVA